MRIPTEMKRLQRGRGPTIRKMYVLAQSLLEEIGGAHQGERLGVHQEEILGHLLEEREVLVRMTIAEALAEGPTGVDLRAETLGVDLQIAYTERGLGVLVDQGVDLRSMIEKQMERISISMRT